MDIFLTTLLHSQLHEFDAYKEWILLGEEPAEAKQFSHPLLTPLLKVFEHVFPSEVPHELPAKRSIKHKIDLIPGSTLPNKPTYRMNPKETQGVQWPVDEHLAKGLIYESPSPCVVLALLVPKRMVA